MGNVDCNDEKGRKRSSRRKWVPCDRKALGGFYEAILSLTIVTLGLVLLTASLALMSAEEKFDVLDLEGEGKDVMEAILSNRTLFSEDRMIDRSDLSRLAWSLPALESSLGVMIMISELNGGTEVLYQYGDPWNVSERASLGEPVNVRCSSGDVRPASLTVWVWR